MIKQYKINRKNINKYKQYKIIKMKRQVIFSPFISNLHRVNGHIDEKINKSLIDLKLTFQKANLHELAHFLCTNSCVVHFLRTIVMLL